MMIHSAAFRLKFTINFPVKDLGQAELPGVTIDHLEQNIMSAAL